MASGSKSLAARPTRANDKFGLHPQSIITEDDHLQTLKTLCGVPPEVEFSLPTPEESPESGRPRWFCIFSVYLTGCGWFFPIPEILLLYLRSLGLAFPQMTPNMLRIILSVLVVATEAKYAMSVGDLFELFSVRLSKRSGLGLYACYPHFDRALVTGFADKDEHWRHFWFFV